MISKLTLALICSLASRLAGAAGVDVLDVYEKLTGKTLLIHNATPRLPGSIVSDLPTEATNAIARMESNFSKNGIAIVHDGPNFVRIFPKDYGNLLTNLLLRGAELQRLPSQKFPAGSINFSGAPLRRVLPIYAAFKQRTVLSPGNLPHINIHLKNVCPLTREEFVYAIETLLAFYGLATVEDGRTFVQVVPMAQKRQIAAHSLTPEPNAKLLDPKKLPSLGNSTKEKPISPVEAEIVRWQIEIYNFFQIRKSPDRPAQRLLEFYASLVAKTAEPSKSFDRMPIWFEIETPVTQSELLYAIETTFSLNNLAIGPAGENRIRLVATGESGNGNRQPDANPPPPQLTILPKP